jgi:hypothetical protein
MTAALALERGSSDQGTDPRGLSDGDWDSKEWDSKEIVAAARRNAAQSIVKVSLGVAG